ncbi:MAG: type III secretion system outer membrane ring subunit SctC [Alphaproteobacteria bacterium]|nr:type III secretion system outer membrane ring subunit SctC [Alphaproteobacteria bacterium]
MPVVVFVVVVFMTMTAGGQAKAQETKLPAGEVVYRTEPVALAQALAEVALVLGIELRQVALPAATLSGRFREPSGQALLDRLASAHDFDWFFDGNAVVAVGRDLRDERSLTFASGAEKSRFLRAARAATTPGFGLAFGHRDDNTLTLTLSGPAPWIGALEDLHLEHTLARAEEHDGAETATVADSSADAADAEFGVMVFRLRHAWAEDKTLLLGEGSTVLAGIASLLASVSGHSDGGANENGDNPEGNSDPAASAAEGGRPAEVIIRAEPRLNAVLVRDRLSRREYYEALIRELDRPIRMVQLEAFIFDISRSRLDELGVRWQVSGNDGAASFAPDAAGELRTLSLARDGLRANVSDREGVLLRLQAIEEEGDGEVLSRPSVLTLNNHEAVFSTSQRFYVRVAANQDAQLFPVTAKTELRVTPRIVSDTDSDIDGGDSDSDIDDGARVHLLISITDGSVDNSAGSQVDSLPQVRESFISTQGLVSDGESLLIGGQITTRSRTVEGGVPILRSIPLFGVPFSYASDTSEELVRIFMLTPRIETLRTSGGG